jgi:exosome complex component RRP41
MVMRYALEPAIFLERYPRSSIDVYAEILQADGGTRCASIIASTVALVDAGIPMKDLVVSCSAGKYNGRIILDLGDHEDKNGEADVPVAYMPKLDKVTLLQMDGVLTSDEMERCISTAIDGCKQIYEVQREALKKKYGIERPEKVEVEEAETVEEKPMEEEEREEDQ